MREVERQIQRPRPILRRAADGSLRAVSDETEVADIWAERDRIRLADAIERDKRKAEKKRRRRERGFFGTRRVPSADSAAGRPKEIEIKISVPKLHLREKIKRIKLPRLTKKQWAAVGAGGLLLIFVVSTQGIYNKPDKPKTAKGTSAVSGASSQAIGGDEPEFTTILPVGKTIDKLGGWGRVSPPTSDPVFAYSDILGGTHIVVSQQQLPASFSGDIDGHVQQVAKQFSATKKLQSKGGVTAYYNLASNGAQSVIFTKSDLLVLIRSTNQINELSWGDYIDDLE